MAEHEVGVRKESWLEQPGNQPLTARMAAAGSRLQELRALLRASEADTSPRELRDLVIDENVTGKRSAISRAKVWRQLRARYVLDPLIAEFQAFVHGMHAADPAEQSLLACLMLARTERITHPLLLQGGQAEEWKRNLLHGLYEEFERQAHSEDLGQKLFGEEAAKGVSLVEALGRKYDVVVTNPPYAGSKNLNERLKEFLEREYNEGKRDVYAAFVQRCRDFGDGGGYTGMVTQQSWLFLRSFARARKQVLAETTVTTLLHLGEHAFDESAAAGAVVVLFTLCTRPPAANHRMAAFRLIGPKSPLDKDALLGRSLAGDAKGVRSSTRQIDLLSIPDAPVVYWIQGRLLELLLQEHKLGEKIITADGLSPGGKERFVRFFWEVLPPLSRWAPFVKGGGFRKWYGYRQYVVDWYASREEIAKLKDSRIQGEQYYFQKGATYSVFGRGAFGLRTLGPGEIFYTKSPGVFAREEEFALPLLALGAARLFVYLLRCLCQGLEFYHGALRILPDYSGDLSVLSRLASSAVVLKLRLVAEDPTEAGFHNTAVENGLTVGSLLSAERVASERDMEIAALLHSIEGWVEHEVFSQYAVPTEEVRVVLDDTSTPVGWHSVVHGYDTVPTDERIGSEIDLRANLGENERCRPGADELGRLRSRLSMLYEAGPGASVQHPEDEQDSAQSADDVDSAGLLGARVPIPAETFVEELSQKLEIHPISIYWLLKEMREQEGLVCPPELKRHLEDYASVSLLRLLGYRWPEQDAYEAEHGPILDPDLVDDDGIIPLVPCGDEPTAAQRIRTRLERQFGEKGADQSEQEFRQWVGRTLEDWLKRDFFKRQIQQFKQRPIAWHFVSPERTFEVFVLYHRLSRETLYKLRTTYAGGLIGRLRAEQDRARQAKDARKVSDLQVKIEDVEEFRDRIEKIERGDELKYRIRCRWKDEEATGRPGPYAPDIDDGVKVNIRPFQEAGVLAVKEVITRW